MQIMGILNVTPDSFSDGGRYGTLDQAIDRSAAMAHEGATIIDIGGESTRPGAVPVPVEEEIARVIPVLTAIKQRFAVSLSIDTSKAQVMHQALFLGVDIINDVHALTQPGSLAAVAASSAKVCLMHMQGTPKNMQLAPAYTDVVAEVKTFLQQRIQACVQAGIAKDRIMIDPGIGFGKTLQHNLLLLKHLSALHTLGCPVLIGFSRKRMFSQLLQANACSAEEQRLYGGLAATAWCVLQGVQIIRTHDVAATRAALATVQEIIDS